MSIININIRCSCGKRYDILITPDNPPKPMACPFCSKPHSFRFIYHPDGFGIECGTGGELGIDKS